MTKYKIYRDRLPYMVNLDIPQARTIFDNIRKQAIAQGDKTIQAFGSGEHMTLCTRDHIYSMRRA